jgi:hypothetical protein
MTGLKILENGIRSITLYTSSEHANSCGFHMIYTFF